MIVAKHRQSKSMMSASGWGERTRQSIVPSPHRAKHPVKLQALVCTMQHAARADAGWEQRPLVRSNKMETDNISYWSLGDNPEDVERLFLVRFKFLWLGSTVTNLVKIQINDSDQSDIRDLLVPVISLLSDLKHLIEITRDYANTKMDVDRNQARELLTLTHQLGDWVDRAKFFGDMIMRSDYRFSHQASLDLRQSLLRNLKRIDEMMVT